ncbi:MAG: PPC domain-containing DNA-binding protein [Cyanobacteriota bacterium]|nr:PPC domain-containing DNA-binding protein [Cyanobacteriota bacterium]
MNTTHLCTLNPQSNTINLMKISPLRLKPSLDIKQSLKYFAIDHQIDCGVMLTAIASLKQATIRFANQQKGSILSDRFEIISLKGTIACEKSLPKN